ncbi:MAG: hypothetical protein UT33_C0017G0013 [Candidatus Peregrinibacteria bacterium GW2011_GWC2_39_14]|nr:MAG: hypothetical protein US92_C0007G0040 [Candidatus Peregrinibacteria bacterium GW2011_GWA2_38_36]KKR04742.1 MAG: hypothetical protein UT33_C0017G0013 [Candidatus Peregrinibacteria bacterium GW2011_GWC2_39_14]
MTFSPDFSSSFFWFFAALALVDIVLLFIYIARKSKAALYACLIIFVILIGVVMLNMETSTSEAKASESQVTVSKIQTKWSDMKEDYRF